MSTLTSAAAAADTGPARAPARHVQGASKAHWLIVGAAALLPFLLYFGTAASIAAIWERSATFAHGYVILPISIWLIWQRRAVLAQLPLRPCLPALAMLALCGAAWMLGLLGDVAIVRQYAFAAMIPLTVLAVAGVAVVRAIAFPLVFILFGVPVGEGLIDPLIQITASFTVDALRATGIPVLREGNNFSIPTGDWSVVEACSGLRYLISSFTLGCLYAYLTYRSTLRRVVFALVALALPVLANGLRAYMIVMIGHTSGMTMAVGVDHLIYGWVFFGLVMLLLFWIGSFWREDRKAELPARFALPGSRSASAARLAAAACGVAACIGVWPAYGWYLDRGNATPAPADLAGYQSKPPVAPPFTAWTPAYAPASASIDQYYDVGGATVGVAVRYYRDGGPERLISSTNRLTEWRTPWHETSTAVRAESIRGKTLQVRETTVSGADGRFVVWQWYWIGGATTASNYVGKALQVKQKFMTGSDDGAAVMVFAPYDEDPAAARPALRAFLRSELDALDAALAANRRQ
ncbi:exosortase A [Pseudoduganella armeniaca]|uniref:Exosortase A n=1 Tax=Pseudoduganella armeniaca TaxID=2072590 RepID=A0A2R4C580_9BURK|nr:exosortase A [Pseudoduganella armeniaca]AVR94776.1 exosortase A [Pseudoduganella armeniaca]